VHPVVRLLALSVLPPLAQAEAPTERYAPAQVSVARDFLERAKAAALRGESEQAGKLAWQASLDARLAWSMTRSEHLRTEAASIGASASVLVRRLAERR